jgi:hypothetical protein
VDARAAGRPAIRYPLRSFCRRDDTWGAVQIRVAARSQQISPDARVGPPALWPPAIMADWMRSAAGSHGRLTRPGKHAVPLGAQPQPRVTRSTDSWDAAAARGRLLERERLGCERLLRYIRPPGPANSGYRRGLEQHHHTSLTGATHCGPIYYHKMRDKPGKRLSIKQSAMPGVSPGPGQGRRSRSHAHRLEACDAAVARGYLCSEGL